MQIVFIRHSMTAGNLERRYIGCRTDEPLCEAGISLAQQKTAEIRQTFPMPEVVLTSPMRRCVQTAEILFPDTPREIVYGLQECDFGDFEGKNYAELSGGSGVSGMDRQRRNAGFSRRRIQSGIFAAMLSGIGTGFAAAAASDSCRSGTRRYDHGCAFCTGRTAKAVLFVAGRTL